MATNRQINSKIAMTPLLSESFCTSQVCFSVTESRAPMSNITRRQFLEDSILAAAAAASIPTPLLAAETRAVSANDKITVAIIGCGIRGKQHASELAKLSDCAISYVCDPDRDRAVEVAADLVEPLARVGGDLGDAGGQGCVCREAGQPQHQRGPPHRAGGAQAGPHLPGRN